MSSAAIVKCDFFSFKRIPIALTTLAPLSVVTAKIFPSKPHSLIVSETALDINKAV